MGCGASGASGAPSNTEKAASSADDTKSSKLELQNGNNEDLRDKYELGKTLGSGSFGQVREAILKSDKSQVRAVKMIERDNEDGEWSNQAIFVREVGLLQTLKHENIIQYFDFYEDLHFLYVVMELCRGGEVFAKIVEMKRFSEKNAASLGHQMLQAIAYIHSVNIAHRDIKAENFMLAEPNIDSAVKMIDFGMATKFEDGQVFTELCGSPHYLAPELIGQKYNHMSDVWAFGVLLYLLMYGYYPYDAKHPRDIMVKILTEPISFHSSKAKLSRECLKFMKRCLEHSPKKRITAADALEHDWMKLKSCDKTESHVELDLSTVRNAHKKLTATRKQIDPKIDELRDQKLKKIDEDYTKGIRQGKRLGPTPKEEYMHKPEHVRRENKITTAPSNAMNARRQSFQEMLSGLSGKRKSGKVAPENSEEAGATDSNTQVVPAQPRQRAASVLNTTPRRLSYIGALSTHEERNLANLWTEQRLPTTAEGDEEEDSDQEKDEGKEDK